MCLNNFSVLKNIFDYIFYSNTLQLADDLTHKTIREVES